MSIKYAVDPSDAGSHLDVTRTTSAGRWSNDRAERIERVKKKRKGVVTAVAEDVAI